MKCLGDGKFVVTALTGRGMIHHVIYGEAVARMVLGTEEDEYAEEWGLGRWREGG